MHQVVKHTNPPKVFFCLPAGLNLNTKIIRNSFPSGYAVRWCIVVIYTLVINYHSNGHGPFEDVTPIENGDVPLLREFFCSD